MTDLWEGHAEFCLSPLHPGPCRGPRTSRREGVRGLTRGSGPLGAPQKKATPAKKAAAPAGGQRGTVYGTPAKKTAAKKAPAKAVGTANPGSRNSMPPTAQQRRSPRSASDDAAGTALMAMRGTDATRDPELYSNNIARRVQMARKKDKENGGGSEEYNKVVTEAALEMATILSRQAGGDARTQRKNRNDLANAISESMRTGDISKVQKMKGELGINSRTASAAGDCGCGSAEGEYNSLDEENIPDELIDPRGDKVLRWSSLIAPIGVPTGDGRTFGMGALSNRNLPLPLRWHREDEGGHKSVVVVGTLDEIDYQEDGVYAGGILFSPDPEQLPRLAEDVAEARMLLDKGVLGPSVDLDDMEFTVQEMAEEGTPHQRPKVDVTKGRISAATLVQIPAFAETAGVRVFEVDAHTLALAATLTASAGGPDEEIVDDPSWTPSRVLTTMDLVDDPDALLASVCAWSGPVDADGQVRHLYPIRDYVEGRPVIVRQAVEFALQSLQAADDRNLVPEGQRAGVMARLRGLLAEKPALTAAAAPVSPPAGWFENPNLRAVTPLTVTEDGRVFGHLATWNTCHVGFPGACVTAPRSNAQYAYFHTGELQTAEGGQVPVGRVTLGGGHADTSLGFQAAIEHYDNAGACVAYARAGEDEHGIWLAGVLAPGVDESKAQALRAHPPSGDWRRIGGALELVGALAVNTPGFPVPRSRVASGAPQALVAAGVVHDADLFEDEESWDTVEAVKFAVGEALREQRSRDRRSAAAVEAFDLAGRRQRASELAGTFGKMPDFIKKKIKAREAAEGSDDEGDDDETVKADLTGKKKGKKALFGGKQAPPFGKK